MQVALLADTQKPAPPARIPQLVGRLSDWLPAGLGNLRETRPFLFFWLDTRPGSTRRASTPTNAHGATPPRMIKVALVRYLSPALSQREREAKESTITVNTST